MKATGKLTASIAATLFVLAPFASTRAEEPAAAAAEPPAATEPAAAAEPAAAEPAAEGASDLAKQLANPIANLISVPFQYTWTTGYGPADADQNRLIVQPVTPVGLNQDWNLIIRTIVPVYIDQQSPVAGGDSQTGLGDVLQSFFFSPKAPTHSGWIWGAGAAFNYPSASEDELGSGKWSAGPTVVVLRQGHGWTYGALVNQLWSFAGSDDRTDVSALFIQPFLSFTNKHVTTFGINTQSTYDWESEQWTVPIFLTVSQLVKIGHRPVSFQLAYLNYVERPANGPDWGIQFTVTLLYPKK